MSLETERAARDKHTILVVDDERQTVRSVEHLLRRRYRVLGATAAHDALALLEDQAVSVVLCDQRMPGMTGDQFFEQVRRRHHDTVRILITAYADMEALVRSVNNGQIFGYVSKPWQPAELERVVATAVDYRELVERNRRITRELSDTNLKLRRANQELRDFTHAVAHDFKEPLRSISAFTEFIQQDHAEQLDGEGRQHLERILRCAHHLEGLVADLMRFGELDGPAPRSVVRLADVVDEVLGLLSDSIRRRGAEVVVADGLPAVSAHPGRLVTLFQNLLANGLKFNRSERPRVEVGGARRGDRVEVFVRDNGIGIAPEYQERIFNIFERLHGRAEFPGTGAGLAIVRKIAESLGGAVRVESAPQQGATFFVELPAAPG